MTCYHPHEAYYNDNLADIVYGDEDHLNNVLTSRYKILLSYYGANANVVQTVCDFDGYRRVDLPCGKCVGCLLEYRNSWVARILAQQYTDKYFKGSTNATFLTLTYDDNHLPYNANLFYKDFQDFINKVRVDYHRKYGLPYSSIKYFVCGEYGENKNGKYGKSKLGRPHYHAIILGVNFCEYFQMLNYMYLPHVRAIINKLDDADKIEPFVDCHMRKVHKTNALRSRHAERLWKKGVCVIGDVSRSSIGYVAGYNVKQKMLVFEDAIKKQEYYTRDDKPLNFPFIHCSKGFGEDFFNTYYQSIYTSGVVRIPGQEYTYKIPRYFDKKLKHKDYKLFEKVKQDRLNSIEELKLSGELSPERLAVKEEIKLRSFAKLVRPMDEEKDFSRGVDEKLRVA